MAETPDEVWGRRVFREVIVAGCLAALAGLVSWGALTQEVDELKRDTAKMEASQTDAIAELKEDVKDNRKDLAIVNNTLGRMEERQKTFQEDIEEIKYLLQRGRGNGN